MSSQQLLNTMDRQLKEYPRQPTQIFRKKSVTVASRPKTHHRVTFTYTSPNPIQNNYKLLSPIKSGIEPIKKNINLNQE